MKKINNTWTAKIRTVATVTVFLILLIIPFISKGLPAKASSIAKVNFIYGDANCDGEVSMADTVLVMQSLANPSRYGLGQKDGITGLGLLQADVCHNDGVTNSDALGILLYVRGHVKSLPISDNDWLAFFSKKTTTTSTTTSKTTSTTTSTTTTTKKPTTTTTTSTTTTTKKPTTTTTTSTTTTTKKPTTTTTTSTTTTKLQRPSTSNFIKKQ